MQKPLLGRLINWAHPLAKGLVGCWLFNEGSGNRIYDLSGNGNHGTFVGTPKWKSGRAGHVIDFVATGDYINLDNEIVFTSSDSWTFSAWINKNADRTADVLFAARTGAETRCFCLDTGEWYLYEEDNVEKIRTSDIADTGVWGHILFLVVSGYPYAYWNGELLSGSRYATTGGYSIGRIGANAAADSSMDGLIDDVRIYNRALTPQEISQLYREPYAMFEPSLSLRNLSILIPGAGPELLWEIFHEESLLLNEEEEV